MASDADFVRRAMAAWFRSGSIGLPSEASDTYEVDGRRYVELMNTRGTLAVYRIENNGRLKRLRRWPNPTKGHLRFRESESVKRLCAVTEQAIEEANKVLDSYALDRGDIPTGDPQFIDEEEDRSPSGVYRNIDRS